MSFQRIWNNYTVYHVNLYPCIMLIHLNFSMVSKRTCWKTHFSKSFLSIPLNFCLETLFNFIEELVNAERQSNEQFLFKSWLKEKSWTSKCYTMCIRSNTRCNFVQEGFCFSCKNWRLPVIQNHLHLLKIFGYIKAIFFPVEPFPLHLKKG